MSGTLLRLDGLGKSFGDVRALGPLDVTLEPGTWGLLGPNGAGKTTLILTLLGVLRPTSGKAEVLGMDPSADPLGVRSRVGYVPEGDAFLPGFTGVGFAAFCGQLMGMSRSDALGRAHEVLDYVGLGEARYRKVSEYSTGMRQRAKLAAALVHDPEMLILDEPTNGLDPAGRKEMLGLLRELGRTHGIPILYASHVLPDVEEVCDRILILERGQARFQGALGELLAEADRTYDVAIQGDAAAVADALRAEGATVSPGEAGRLRVTLPAVGREDLILRAVVGSGARLRGMRQVARDLEQGFTSALEAKA
ncbi:MAG TPA: ABC transporter ATP-binding protein [Candidatus Thermoplasmatota archaeon]|nr:ABC transporter ATP-binding protein [Candidatus Thermoplasmatota archaeon]